MVRNHKTVNDEIHLQGFHGCEQADPFCHDTTLLDLHC